MATIPNDQDTTQDCYTMAYLVLPRYVFDDARALVENLARDDGAGFFYLMASRMNRPEPRMELFRSFPVHLGDLGAGTRYCVVEYPKPPAVDLSDLSLEEMFAQAGHVVLAPYFSAIVLGPDETPRYFILGQSPDGFTTFRLVEPNLNANLGPGCEPELDAFVDLLRERVPSAGAE